MEDSPSEPKPESIYSQLLTIAKWLGALIFVVYLYSMVISPFANGGWKLLLATWKEWQTFNAGMIALLAAGITAQVTMRIDRNARALKLEELEHNEKQKEIQWQRELARDEERKARELIVAKSLMNHCQRRCKNDPLTPI